MGLAEFSTAVDRLVQARRQGWLAEFRDIGARHECAALAGENANLDFRILRELRNAIDQRDAHADADRVDRADC